MRARTSVVDEEAVWRQQEGSEEQVGSRSARTRQLAREYQAALEVRFGQDEWSAPVRVILPVCPILICGQARVVFHTLLLDIAALTKADA
eukprot:3022371-Rhodomonas_salina.5